MYQKYSSVTLAALPRIIAVLITLMTALVLNTCSSAAPSVEIVPLDLPIPADAPTIPWVAVGDQQWHNGKPVFDVSDGKDAALWAKGWMAVTSEDILIQVVVHHGALLSSGGGRDLWSGDSIQFGIDPLGRGAAQPTLPEVSAKAAEGNMIDLQPEDQDFCVGAVLPKQSTAVYSYYSGHGNAGDVHDVTATITRDNAAQLTTYAIAIPWSEFGLRPGLSPLMKISFQINNTNGRVGNQTRLYWGGGVGGRFAPWKFQTLALGAPPVGTKLCSLSPVQSYLTAVNDYAETLAAVCGVSASISAQCGEAKQSFAAPRLATLQRFSIRAYPGGALHGSLPFTAALLNTDTHVTNKEAVRVFDDSSANWYAFSPKSDTAPSVVSMADWLDAPAGKHGFIQGKGKDLVFEDGVPVKLWGVGTQAYAPGLAMDKGRSDAYAAWYQKWGVNCVRNGIMFTAGFGGIGDPNDTTKLNPDQLDLFDYSFSTLKNKGIYYNLSAFWRDDLRPADKDKVLNYAEAKDHASELDNFAEDIQDLRITAVVNFLQHKNPYTGLTYAQDGALAALEMRNEQDIYFYNVSGSVAACPTYQARVNKQFCDWLRARYGTREKLVAAWGARCIGCMFGCAKDESLDNNSLNPIFNAWFFSSVGVADQQAHFGGARRLLDSAEFLYECQTKYYTRFAKAIRATGYKGVLVGSNWQAADNVSHLYNLLSDREVGRIDRHNYYGGSDAWGLQVGVGENDDSMLWQPGGALLSSGMQQLADRPFALTEWMEQAPNEWEAEGSPLIGFYGFGLQGWDAAFAGNCNEPSFSSTYGTWLLVQNPVNLGLYPAIARAVLRGDIKEGAIIGARRFSRDDLRAGQFNFSDTVVQNGDVKSISSTVPAEALAAGRVVLELVEHPTPSLIPNLTRQLKDKVIVSNTGQLTWHYPRHDASYFTVNTDGTKGLVGFAPKDEVTLGKVRLQVDSKFAVLLVTALERDKTLANTHAALITAIARSRNTGMSYDASRSLTAVGTGPIVLEPVFGSVTFARKVAAVYLLDHDGKRTTQLGNLVGGKLTIDGIHDKTMYYEVVFE